jgi:hypothetical protein
MQSDSEEEEKKEKEPAVVKQTSLSSEDALLTLYTRMQRNKHLIKKLKGLREMLSLAEASHDQMSIQTT